MNGQRASAQITLTALNSLSILPAKRFLNLTPKEPTVRIGRSSKSTSKNLVAAVDNAWFDSPVMSRDHAEITLHIDNKTIQIQDVGSMHGTLLNDEELQPKEFRSLNSGDVVKFGAEVRRGSETFPACTFKVEYEIKSPPSLETTEVPETMDLDDEVDDATDEEQSVLASSSSEVNEENTPRDSIPSSSISLDSPLRKRSVSLEIVEAFSGPKGLTEGQAQEDIMNMKKVSGNAENPLVVDDSDDDDEDMDDEEADVEMSENSDNSDNDSEDSNLNISIAPLDSDSESESEAEETSVVIEEVRRLSDNNGIEISNVRSTAVRDSELWGDSDAIDSDSESDSDMEHMPPMLSSPVAPSSVIVLSDVEDSDDSDSGSNDSNDSIDSVMGDTGISYQASEPESNAADSLAGRTSDEDFDMAIPASSDEISKYDIMKKALASEIETEFPTKATASVSFAPWVAYQTPTAEPAREPSPSDAAMVKEDIPTTSVDITTAEVTTPSAAGELETPLAFAQSMGEKTGKEAFFHAREVNKAQVAARSDDTNVFSASWHAPRPPPFRHNFARPTLPSIKALAFGAVNKDSKQAEVALGHPEIMLAQREKMLAQNERGNEMMEKMRELSERMREHQEKIRGHEEIPRTNPEPQSKAQQTRQEDTERAKYPSGDSTIDQSRLAQAGTTQSDSQVLEEEPRGRYKWPLVIAAPVVDIRAKHREAQEKHCEAVEQNHQAQQRQAREEADRVRAEEAQEKHRKAMEQALQQQRRAREEADRARAESDRVAMARAMHLKQFEEQTKIMNQMMEQRYLNPPSPKYSPQHHYTVQPLVTPTATMSYHRAGEKIDYLGQKTDRCSGVAMTDNPMPSFNFWVDQLETANFSSPQVLSPFALETLSRKRKADEISTESEVVAANEESASSRVPSEEPTAFRSIISDVINQPSHIAAPVVAVQGEQEVPPRPAKRFKRFAEAVGFAALGGAAVGAGLFSVLVATAPDFM